MNSHGKHIRDRLIEHIDSWDPVWGQYRWDDSHFDALARDVFTYQYEHNAPYRAFCEGRGIHPDGIISYAQIPAVPTDVFKLVQLSTMAPDGLHGAVFKTSGTTQGQQGSHFMTDTTVYEASLYGPFLRHCVPDETPRRMLVLHPSSKDLPTSSLSFMIDCLLNRYGKPNSAHYVGIIDGQWRWQLDAFVDALNDAIAHDESVVILGTAFGLMHILDNSEQSWQLPPGSVLMETGGFKGRSRTLERDALYELFEARFGIERARCVSEYSMTELSAQAYSDNVHQLLFHKKRLDLTQRRFRTPPWARVVAVDPVSLAPRISSNQSTEGLLCWYDLSNLWSVMAVQTSDMGIVDPDGGFQMLGRAEEATLRGCSLTIEEIQTALEDTP